VRNLSDVLESDLLPKVFVILSNPGVSYHYVLQTPRRTVAFIVEFLFQEGIYDTSSTIESKLHDAATELLCNVLRALRGPDSDCVLDINLYTKIAAFESAYHTAVARENIEKYVHDVTSYLIRRRNVLEHHPSSEYYAQTGPSITVKSFPSSVKRSWSKWSTNRNRAILTFRCKY
jgi:hypothetical protein